MISVQDQERKLDFAQWLNATFPADPRPTYQTYQLSVRFLKVKVCSTVELCVQGCQFSI